MRRRIPATILEQSKGSRQNEGSLAGRGWSRARTAAALCAVAFLAAFVGIGLDRPMAAVAPEGAGFNLNASDLRFILKQIKIAEQHAATRTPENPCGTLLGPGPDQIPDSSPQTRELPFGLRTVDGSCNNLVAGREKFGKAEEKFPRMLTPRFRDGEAGDPDGPGPAPDGPTSYLQNDGFVIDSRPRTISNLIVDQTATNPAAVEAAGPNPVVTPSGSFHIPNVAPDVGLSAPFNVWFIFFGQFFDHGLDLVKKGGNGTVFMPLRPDDPLFRAGPDNIPHTADDPPNFMLLTRATHSGDHEHTNLTNPLVDQQQTYASHSSHQVFLREYANNAEGKPVSTGRLLTGPGGGMSNWSTLKAQALNLLGIELRDTDVFAVPLLATDPYGRFLRGPNGFPQMVKVVGGTQRLVEGNPAAPINTDGAVLTGQAFLDDIAHHAVPGPVDHDNDPATPKVPAVPDADPGTADDRDPATYDDEMLAAHFMAGDGRVNENITLTAVHHIFHSEHNRLTGHIKDVLVNEDPTMVPEWQLAPGVWNGERIFQAARFVTEMEYQHLAFEEFVRKVQPMVHEFGEAGTGFHPEINPSVPAEFAHTAFRMGHSMLAESIDRVRPDGTRADIRLLDAFLNPPALMAGGLTADQAVGSIVRGTTRQVGNEIDEFVTDVVRNSLLGLPLDLTAINMARGRDTGVPPLNEARRQFFRASANSALAPYQSWADFGFNLKNPKSLVNFIAAYGTHPSVTSATSMAAKRAAAELLVNADAANPATPADAVAFLNSTGAWANRPDGVTITGVDEIDYWVGGLAEKKAIFGGFLGSTLNYVFQKTMEDLQDGDRFYYLSRTAGLNLLTQLEGNSFAELIMRNSDAAGLPADVFSRPDFIFDVSKLGTTGSISDDPATAWNEAALLIRMPDGTIRFGGPEHVVWNGTAGNDRIWSSEGDDTIRGDDGNDWIEGGDGNDNHIGGLGDDTLLDSAGDDNLKGGDGNDTLSSGPGFGGDLNQGGRGSDFIVGGSAITETFGGPGNDFIFAGDSEDTVFGDDGDDWIEGGRGPFNLLQGDNGAPFQDDPNLPGHDVLQGNGGEQDMDSEGGDDIMLLGAGIQRAEGMLGFDWTIHKLDPLPGDSDMTFGLAELPAVDNGRDRFDRVEGLSGWNLNDVLRGDNTTAAQLSAVNLGGTNNLTPAGVARIAGLQEVLGGATSFDAGNIILGGAGSDLIEGRGGNDILDGDRWLDVEISVRDGADPTIELRRVDGLSGVRADVIAGTINPTQLRIVRQIRTAAPGTDIDIAVFSGPRADYDILVNPDGSVNVVHARNAGVRGDGIDTLRNIERLRFADVEIAVPAVSDAVPGVSLSPVSLTFADQTVGTTSAAQVVTLTNSGNAALNITVIKIEEVEGAPPEVDFALAGGTCGVGPLTVEAGRTCTIHVTFAPTATGLRQATLEIFSNAAGSPHGVPLSGRGVAPAPAVSLDPASLTFADRLVGTASAAQTVTLTNSGTAALNITGLALAGANPGDFTRGGTCVAPSTIAIGASCTITAAFAPTAAGARNASVQITSNAAGSPHSVPLSGTGIAPAPAVSLAPASLAFADQIVGTASAAQTVTLTNTGTGPLSITGVALAGANPGDFTRGGTCNAPSTVAAGASCTITASFAPTATGPRSASVQITSDAAGSPHSIPLSGNGTAPPPTVLLGAEVIQPATDFNPAGLAEAFRVTASATGTLATLRVFVDASSAATTMIAGLFSNSATDHPGTLLGRGSITNPVAGAWNDVPLASGVPVTAGTVYWIAVLSPSGAGELRFRDGCCGGGQPAETSSQNALADLPGTWTTGQTFLDGPISAVGMSGLVPADTAAPTVSISSPAEGASVSAVIDVTATAGDNVGVGGVQFKLDGANLGAEDGVAPYSVSWDTAGVANGSHALTAVARDGAGNVTTSAVVTVNVNNAAPAPAPAPAPSGLVAAYSFNEGAGTSVGDGSGSGNGGTLSGAAWSIAGKFGGALSFDGVDDWVTVADSPSLDLSSAMTLEAWVRPSSLPAWPTVVMKETTGDLVYALYANSDATGPMGFATGAVSTHSATKLAVDGWTHLALTYDGSALRLYVNGTEISARLVATTMAASAGPLRIGGNGVFGEWFSGLIDEVRIYNRALTGSEIGTDMTTAITP